MWCNSLCKCPFTSLSLSLHVLSPRRFFYRKKFGNLRNLQLLIFPLVFLPLQTFSPFPHLVSVSREWEGRKEKGSESKRRESKREKDLISPILSILISLISYLLSPCLPRSRLQVCPRAGNEDEEKVERKLQGCTHTNMRYFFEWYW